MRGKPFDQLVRFLTGDWPQPSLWSRCVTVVKTAWGIAVLIPILLIDFMRLAVEREQDKID